MAGFIVEGLPNQRIVHVSYLVIWDDFGAAYSLELFLFC
jgi:hypothetical protein